jgi:hypothetical protein
MPITLNGTTGIVSPALDSDSSLTVGPAVMDTPTGSAPLFAARAWVNFNGTGTVAIRASGNVSSITDNGTGDYTVNFTTAMPDVNYAVPQGASDGSSPLSTGNFGFKVQTMTTASVRGWTGYASSADATFVFVSIFR